MKFCLVLENYEEIVHRGYLTRFLNADSSIKADYL